MARIAIVTDRGADIPQEVSERLNIFHIPLIIHWQGQDYVDGVNLSKAQFQEMLNSETLPTTSQPAPGVFAEIYQEALDSYDQIISIHVTSKASGTFQAAQIAADMLADKDITIVDSAAVSMAQGWQVIRAAELAQEGKDKETILQALVGLQEDMASFIVIPTLRYLSKSGRVPKVASLLGKMISIKPILSIEDGEIIMWGKTRAINKGLTLILEEVSRRYQGQRVNVAVVHADNGEAAADFAQKLHETLQVNQLLVASMGTTLQVHGGPGMIGVSIILSE